MYVCMYVCMYVRMYVCTYVSIYVCVQICTYVHTYIHPYTYIHTYIQRKEGVPKILGQTALVITHTLKDSKFTSIYVDKYLAFEVQTTVLQNSFHGNTLETLVFRLKLNIKIHFTRAFLMPVKQFKTTMGPLNVCDSPWS